MGPGALLSELRDGQSPAARQGLFWLGLGALVTLLVMFLLTPSMNGLIGLPGHDLAPPSGQTREPSAPKAVPLSPYQKAVMRRDAVRSAVGELGVRERPGRDNVGGRIVTYRKAVIGAGENPYKAEPWCADFVSWLWRRSGAPIGFGGAGSDYVPELVAWAHVTRNWHRARDGYKPKPGDLIVYRESGNPRGHIGMVVKLTRGRVHTVEGNYSDRVQRRTIKPWDATVTGFISPV